ncbi:spondin domain-containing protein [Shewanella fidelis]|uniref:Spondin domain-containing protein n=1 Tax=Shewanella fidelis TaxID=173509 RepID=A0AAW8NV54_9GAMM|nr:spondin domain-containing protein [Shewanella fidelis]MDR8525378.1 spondin domain-containing protein [Shewanella fidelis]MDW4813586.1 spondin domain-containing protein [Shewanella fidelis]MDW4817756.1 spondin domain-containing protein [Shewanella fidelis]MDW4821823.1 spondin domain-containing protein [Shewanella fidelis]MDW4825914.1 spondin domain-containing protein [Shewanella fidelis]
MKLNPITKLLILGSIITLPATAAEIEISITNLTHGNHFTPLLIAAHDADSHLFQVGEMATSALQKMAEGGDIGDLDSAVMAANGVTVTNPAAGLLAPSAKVEGIMLDTGDMTHLSIVAMVLPTNDAFVGLDAWQLPTEAGSYSFTLNAYDAGTEANDEIVNGGGMSGVAGIPAAPGGDGGMNATGVMDMSSNDKVHIHPGVLGDTDLQGGMSDLDSRVHRWLNPVARVTVTVK